MPWRHLRHREPLLLGVAAAVLTILVAWLGPRGGDLAAHEYQRQLFLHHGFTLWDNDWYAGRYAFVGYSVLYYPLAAVLGITPLGVVTVAASATAFALLLEREWGASARWASRSFALVWAGLPITGEYPFALGIALALLALLALQAGRRWAAAGLMLLVLAASPVALLLLAVVLGGILLARRATIRDSTVPALALVAAAGVELVLLRLFPVSGNLGFPPSEAAAALVFCAIGIGCTLRLERARVLRFVFAAYAVAIGVLYVVPSGIGDTVVRLRFLALPLALLVLALRRWRPFSVSLGVVALALAWNVSPLAAGWARSASDPTARPKVWRAPVAYLHAHLQQGYRVEAVDTTEHWPAFYLANANIPLVRGWFRQDDFPFDRLLYRARPLTPAAYLHWLRGLGVAYVVLTTAPPDYSSRREARLVGSGRAGLTEVFSTKRISIYAVPRPEPIVRGPDSPRVLALRDSRLLLRVSSAGTYRLALRWSPYWHASSGCLTRRGDGMLQLRTPAAATVRIAFDVDASSLFAAFAGARPRCGSS